MIKDLQLRVQEYEVKGVAATQEMQRAARKVAQENERLRILLARQGILKEEIDSFLRSCEQMEDSAEPEAPMSGVRTSRVLNPYPKHAGPRSLGIQPSSQAYSRDYSPRASPISRPPPVQIARQPVVASPTTSHFRPEIRCGPTSKTLMEIEVEAATMARPVEACRKVEAYYNSSPSSRPQEGMPAFTFPECTPSITQSQGCCPPPRPPPEAVMEDLDCPSTTDCFCPPTTTIPSITARPAMSSDEISCETAATIIAQMRGDGDESAARASIGCAPQQVCTIKNAFLMQVLDER